MASVIANTKAPSCNQFYSGKAIDLTRSECVFVALVIQHAKCTRRFILYSVCLSGYTMFLFFILYRKQHDVLKKRCLT